MTGHGQGQGQVEIVTIGDELLLGQTIDTNAAWLSEQLANVGIRVTRRTTVGDDAQAIRSAVQDALARTRVVICTGGLGPTKDDLTRPAIAELYGRELDINGDLLEKLEARWQQRGLQMPASNRTQAEVPRGARILPNALGTAPGLALEDDKLGLCIMLPGVPHELRALTLSEVIPLLLARSPERAHPLRYRVLRTTGIAESALAERIDDVVRSIEPLSVAFLPGFAGTDLRVTCWGLFDERECEVRFDAAEAMLRARLSTHIYARGDADLSVIVGALLKERGLTVAVAESCTGGLLGKRITDVSGASAYFLGGFIAYADDAKVQLLGVRTETLRSHGAVSEQTAREMAAGARERTGADVALAITGIAGPTGGTTEKPVGLVWSALAFQNEVRTRRFVFPGDRAEIRERATQMALALLYDALVSKEA